MKMEQTQVEVVVDTEADLVQQHSLEWAC